MEHEGESYYKFLSEGDVSISRRRKEWWSKLPEETKKLLEEDAKYFLHQALSTPCLDVLAECEGIYITNIAGKKYMDFHGNNVHHVGFRNSKVIQAIREQMEKLPFCTRRYTNVVAIRLAKKLAEITGLGKCLFAPSGNDAMEIALKLAMGYTKRFKTVSWWDSFHGAGFGPASIGGEAIFRGEISLLPGTNHVPPPDCYRCVYGHSYPDCNLECAQMIRYVIEKEGGDVAAVISETIRSTPYVPPYEYWKEVRKICDENNVVLIIDEIPHCLGRTGKMFTFQHYDILPDILVIGKSLGGGIVPIAATVAKREMDVMGHRAIGHYTHEKNPVLCAAALATIQYIEENKLVENAAIQGEYALKRLNEMKDEHKLIGDVRGKGLLLGIELVKDHKKKTRAIDEAEAVMYRCLEKGLSFKLTMGNILTLTPPLTITREEMDKALDIIDESIHEIEQQTT